MLLTAAHSLDNIPFLVVSACLLALSISIFFQKVTCFAPTPSSATLLAPCQVLALVQVHVWIPSTFDLYPVKGCPSVPKLNIFPVSFLLYHHALLEKSHFTLHRVVHMSLPLGSLHWHLPPRQAGFRAWHPLGRKGEQMSSALEFPGEPLSEEWFREGRGHY